MSRVVRILAALSSILIPIVVLANTQTGGKSGLLPAPDITPPGIPTGFSGLPGDGQVSLSWNDPPEQDYSYTELDSSPAGAGTWTAVNPNPTSSPSVIGSLTNDADYDFRARHCDTSDNCSTYATTTSTPAASGTTGLAPSEIPWASSYPFRIDNAGDVLPASSVGAPSGAPPNGSYTDTAYITTPGTTLDGYTFTSRRIRIQADNVTIKNSVFDCQEQARCVEMDGGKNLLLEDNTFSGSTNAQVFLNDDATLRNNIFWDMEQDIIKWSSAVGASGYSILLEGNYFRGTGISGTSLHADIFQQTADSTSCLTVRGNTFINQTDPQLAIVNESRGHFLFDKYGSGHTTRLARTLFWGDAGGQEQFERRCATVEYNFFDGGQFFVFFDPPVEDGDVIVRNNAGSVNFRGSTVGGPFSGGSEGFQRCGNRWYIWTGGGTDIVDSTTTDGPEDPWRGPWTSGDLLPGESACP